jgi:hypothetical protein
MGASIFFLQRPEGAKAFGANDNEECSATIRRVDLLLEQIAEAGA